MSRRDRIARMARVLGVLAGGDAGDAALLAWASSSEAVYAADGGADRLLRLNLTPDAVVGDLDSTRMLPRLQELRAENAIDLIHDPDPSTTDCDKLLSFAARQGHSEITLFGVEGDQLDHVVSTLHSAAKATLRVRIVLRSGIGWVLRKDEGIEVPAISGRRVSLLPLTDPTVASLSGVEWPLDLAKLSPTGLTSISNRASREVVAASVHQGVALLTVEFPSEELPQW